MRILIAEDDFTSRTMLTGVLKKRGYEVVETVNGVAAWDALRQTDAPRLVILDWMMPEMDGLEVLGRVRAVQTERPPYVIILTARDETSDIVAGLDAGANDYLAKPFDPGELIARVQVGRRMVAMQEALIQSKQALEHQATHDSLTGMLNRRAIYDHLRKELSHAERHGDGLAVGMCDIDHFKQINDTYGHQAGDDVLSGLAQILRENLREYDLVGRVGGEEFLLIMPKKAGTDPVPLFVRLCKRVAESKIMTRSGELSITVSIGVACEETGTPVDQILKEADAALYRAKHEGRNRVAYCG